MRNHLKNSIILSLLFVSLSAKALYPHDTTCFPHPLMPYSADEKSSIEDIEKNLKALQANFQNNIAQINQQLQSLQQFLSAQKALKINWVKVKTEQRLSRILTVSYGDKKTQICRAKFISGTHPGLVTSSGCLITYGGYSAFIPDYEILVSNMNTQWKKIDSSTLKNYQNLMSGPNKNTLWKQKFIPIQGGFENNTPLYICKANYNNDVKIGKVINEKICDFADGAKEISTQDFEVLFGETSAI